MFAGLRDHLTGAPSLAVVHSDLMALGRGIVRFRGRVIPKILEETGLHGLYVPTFTFDSTPDTVFDTASPPTGMGAVAQELVDNIEPRGYGRTLNPVHSYGYTSPDMAPDGDSLSTASFGAGSVFDWFYRENVLWLNLASAPDDSFTVFHHAEALAGVPYREWIQFPRQIGDGTARRIDYDYFSRCEDIHPDYGPAVELLVSRQALTRVELGKNPTYVGRVRPIVDVLVERLKEEPYFLVAR